MITLNDVKAAAVEISSYVRRTPLWKSETLSTRLGTNVYPEDGNVPENGVVQATWSL